jgi:hydroxymethylglutaryl-CoA synthase
MQGIVAYGSYLPRYRLQRSALAATLGVPAGRGARTVASHDEDPTTMAVEASRIAVGDAPVPPASLWFATSRAPYLDKTNATSIAAALQCDAHVGAYDVGGALRSSFAALRAGASAGEPSLVALADMRFGLPGSDEEAGGGDAAAAFVFGDADPIATIAGTASVSREFMDRWRAEGAVGPSKWDERWSAGIHGDLMQAAAEEALKRAEIDASDVDHLVVSSAHRRAASAVARAFGQEVLIGNRLDRVGYAGVADPGLGLVEALAAAEPDQVILLVVGADGADAMVLRTTAAIAERPRRPLDDRPGIDVDVARYHTWRGLLRREPPRRPEPTPPASPPSARNEHWKFGFVASECGSCGARHMPPQRVCQHCHAIDQMSEVSLRDSVATVRTFTVDHLAFSLSPPTVVAVLDFDGGGRYPCQLADVEAGDVHVGMQVQMTYRVLDVARNGARNYFWKARPITTED